MERLYLEVERQQTNMKSRKEARYQRSGFKPGEGEDLTDKTVATSTERKAAQTLIAAVTYSFRETDEHKPLQELQTLTYKSTQNRHTPAARGSGTTRRCRRAVKDSEIAASEPLHRDRIHPLNREPI
ncbi:hypothetical protein Bca4012_036638 [Brassica carinata]